MIKKIVSCFIFVLLTSCSANQIVKNIVKADSAGAEYVPATENESNAKVIMVCGQFDLCLFYQDDSQGLHAYKGEFKHPLPAEKKDFNIPMPDTVKGEIVHSFNMKAMPIYLDLAGYDSSIWANRSRGCQLSSILFNPKQNANYIFYLHKVDEKKCTLDIQEAVYENGTYKYINVPFLAKKWGK